MTRVFLHTFGCKANQYDSEVVRQALESVGATMVPDASQADVAVVNSCTVTHVSESKLRALVRRVRRANPNVRTVVMGCAAALDDGALDRLPGVVAVVPGAAPARVLEALDLPVPENDPILRRFDRGTRAWLKIQDGCDEHCTFCATTIARGTNRSRMPEEVVAEARALGETCEEIVLTGVHIGGYGCDLDPVSDLGRLVERLVRDVTTVRFRLSSIEATEIDDRLADVMVQGTERLVPHIHAPLQSGSDRLLKRMGRHWYTAATYRDSLFRLADSLPVLGLGADIIVGFPGETPDDHDRTCELVEILPFTYLHVFPYSERPGSAARRLGPPVDPAVVADRSAELRELADRKGSSHRMARVGGAADVVALRRLAGHYEGLTEDYISVRTPADRPLPPRFKALLRYGERGTLEALPVGSG